VARRRRSRTSHVVPQMIRQWAGLGPWMGSWAIVVRTANLRLFPSGDRVSFSAGIQLPPRTSSYPVMPHEIATSEINPPSIRCCGSTLLHSIHQSAAKPLVHPSIHPTLTPPPIVQLLISPYVRDVTRAENAHCLLAWSNPTPANNGTRKSGPRPAVRAALCVYDASGTDGVGIGIRQRHAATARQPKSSAAVCSLPRTVHGGARGLEIGTSSAGGR